MLHIDGGAYGRVRYDVYGKTTFNVDVIGESDNGYGVYDLSKSRDGVVVGFSPHGSDVHSQSINCHGMLGTSSRFGMHGVSIQDADVVGIDRNGGAGLLAA
jgi:hypothetical protein